MTAWWNPEAPWWAKLRRADGHIDEVDRRAKEYLETEPWRVERVRGRSPNEVGYVLRVQRPVPADFLTIVGDAVHNLRSSLDTVAYELAARSTNGNLTAAQERASEFPLRATPEKFEEFFSRNKKRKGIFDDAARRALRSAQPFALTEQWGRTIGEFDPDDEFLKDHLTRLHKVSRVDKHRRLPLVAWFPNTVYWPKPEGDVNLLWASNRLSHFEDGSLLGYIREVDGTTAPEVEVFHDLHLALIDDPAYRGDLVATLRQWSAHIQSWILPRIFVVADEGKPPLGTGWVGGPGSHLP